VIAARRRVAVTALLAALIVAPGCLRAEYGYEISADGGGRIELQIRFQEELIRTLEQVGLGDVVRGDVGIVEEQLDRLPAEWRDRVEVESVDDGAGIDVRVRFDDLEQLEELRALGDVGIPVVTRNGEAWRAEIDYASIVGAAGTLAPAADEFTSSDIGSVLSDALGALVGEPEIVLRITMPGPITAADPGAQIDGRTASWTVTADASGTAFVESSTAPAGLLGASIGGAPLWGIGLLALVVVAAIVAVAVVRARGRSAPAAGTVAAPPTATWTPVPPSSAAVPPLGGWAAPAPATPPLLPPGPAPSEVTATLPVVFDRTETMPVASTAGWHADPWGQATWRWWDGRAWSEHVC